MQKSRSFYNVCDNCLKNKILHVNFFWIFQFHNLFDLMPDSILVPCYIHSIQIQTIYYYTVSENRDEISLHIPVYQMQGIQKRQVAHIMKACQKKQILNYQKQ